MQRTLQQGFNVVFGVNNFGRFIPCLHNAQSRASPAHWQEEQPLPGLLAHAGTAHTQQKDKSPKPLTFPLLLISFIQLPPTASQGILP